ncbi:MAG: aldehyde dehydrogenase (NADP(+)) [Chloroflexota bacterium]
MTLQLALQPVLIAGEWRSADSPVGSFTAMNPATQTALPDEYPVSSLADVELAIRAAQEAVVALRSLSPDHLANFLEAFAANIEARAEALVEMAHLETAYPKATRLSATELPRTTNQLRQAAAAARSRSWVHANIDTQANIRSMFAPLNGAVVVFGPNNFPFAFNSVAGGDFAAAIAAGNPVIAKANLGHPGTTRLLAEAAFEAVRTTGLPDAMIQLIYHMPAEVGFALVSHPLIGATGFTGSRNAGMRLKAAADQAGKPIYLEMSSVNPIFVLPGALTERGQDIAADFTASCLLGAGQFCTNPGMVVLVDNEQGQAFVNAASESFQSKPAGILLSERGPRNIADSIEILQQHGAEVLVGGKAVSDFGFAFQNTLLRVSGDIFDQHADALQTEAFGAVSLLVVARDEVQLIEIARHLDGNLTGSIYSDRQGSDDALYAQLEPVLRPKVGRLLNDKMPTGVAVSPAMNHGGPYPATGHPGFTSVGIPASMLRFAALYSYDNVRPQRLPPELQDKNPTGHTWRLIDGEWTQRDM